MQTIKLDLQRQSILPPLKAKQNDRYSRFFKVVLLDGSAAFSIPSGAALTVRYISPSGSGWYDTITEIDNTTKHSAFAISGNEVTVELAESTLTKPGNGMLCLQIYTATGYRIGTWNIPLEIEADPLADSTIAASDYYNVLTAQVAQTLQYKNDAASSAQAAAASAALAQQISQQGKGWFATDTALKAAFPTGQNGWWAIVGAGDNIWTWDADTSAWVNTHTQTDFTNYYTKAQADEKFAPVAALTPTGAVISFAGTTAPNGWLLCDGAEVSRTSYAALFAILGTTFGVGNGSSTFNLPDMRERMVVGSSTGIAFGSKGGEKEHVLIQAELPAIKPSLPTVAGSGATIGLNDTNCRSTGAPFSGVDGNLLGSGQAHNNMPPYIAINYIIKT